ncbi:hypothetical protein MTHERMOG20_21430 [Moorella thermoacetica]|uniref:ElyC/SanA/YdcF family protein n=1 Tax=Neomoorella thermoacetica TaxID=1525 RepID=UPI000039B650|nr:ElyC/SanA/YdcF family protein [Moorella thermoacetica]AKX93428.1 UDP-glucose 4-epimerase [Moorella thermoacetica]AKX96076.1 UDP-glucose 4-epimerase [Moorella thermoacetica]OIQ55288.1 UDP-glucose 4-epimerase [Moorella thermoacetica]OIQ60460.1 UDP-glucose 4-epimerase [Moorella thermoacetica]QCZ99886.1 UDP-glucose 4-epimerase [Moorella thermoacetica]
MIIVLSGEQGERVATGVKLYREGLAPRLLMTGGPVKWNVAAADIMADQAKFLGVPEKDIVLEKWAISTYENSLYSLMALGPGDRSGGPGYPYVISMPPGYRRQGILGRAVRDYIHVDDLAAAHVLALEALEQGSPTAAYNLGSGRGYSVLEVIRTAEKVTGKKVPCRVGPRRPGDQAVLVASAEKAMAELGWRPRYTELEDIIATAWQWHCRRPRGYSQGYSPAGR